MTQGPADSPAGDSGTIDRAERLAPLMQKRPEWEPFRMTASAAMRVALLKGLDQLEAELKGRRP